MTPGRYFHTPFSRGKGWGRGIGRSKMQRVGGGILVAIGLIAGSVIGVVNGEPSAGLVIGLVVGLAAAGLLTLWDARRR